MHVKVSNFFPVSYKVQATLRVTLSTTRTAGRAGHILLNTKTLNCCNEPKETQCYFTRDFTNRTVHCGASSIDFYNKIIKYIYSWSIQHIRPRTRIRTRIRSDNHNHAFTNTSRQSFNTHQRPECRVLWRATVSDHDNALPISLAGAAPVLAPEHAAAGSLTARGNLASCCCCCNLLTCRNCCCPL
jgi:hypothetical protein